jgi:hypothetical protein
MNDKEEELLLALEAQSRGLVSEFNAVLDENPLLKRAINDDTNIITYLDQMNRYLAHLKKNRTIEQKKEAFTAIIRNNFDNWGVLEDDADTRRELIAGILYDLEKAGYQFLLMKPTTVEAS